MSSRLTPKQARFVAEYLLDLNATQAAIRAGYSRKTAYSVGPETLKKPGVQAAITVAQAARQERTAITQDRVLEELAVLAFSDLEHYHIDAQGAVTLTPEAPRAARRALSSVKRRVMTTENGCIYDTEIKLWSKTTALHQLGLHLGLYDGSGKTSGDVQAQQRAQTQAAAQLRAHLDALRQKRQQLAEVIPDAPVVD